MSDGSAETNEMKMKKYLGDGLPFKGKLIGMEDLSVDRDEKVCLDSMFKLKAVVNARGEHKQKVQLNLTTNAVKIFDDTTKVQLAAHEIERISFVVLDPRDTRAFGYIYNTTDNRHQFWAIKTERSAASTVISLKELFEAAFEQYTKSQGQENQTTTQPAAVIQTPAPVAQPPSPPPPTSVPTPTQQPTPIPVLPPPPSAQPPAQTANLIDDLFNYNSAPVAAQPLPTYQQQQQPTPLTQAFQAQPFPQQFQQQQTPSPQPFQQPFQPQPTPVAQPFQQQFQPQPVPAPQPFVQQYQAQPTAFPQQFQAQPAPVAQPFQPPVSSPANAWNFNEPAKPPPAHVDNSLGDLFNSGPSQPTATVTPQQAAPNTGMNDFMSVFSNSTPTPPVNTNTFIQPTPLAPQQQQQPNLLNPTLAPTIAPPPPAATKISSDFDLLGDFA